MTTQVKTPEGSPDPQETQPESLLDRLSGFRRRLVICVGVVVVSCLTVFSLGEDFFWVLMQPLCRAFESLDGRECVVYPMTPIEPVVVYFKLGILVGLFVSTPIIFYQIWSMVAPALLKQQKVATLLFVGAGSFFFVGGGLFGYFVVFPLSFQFLLGIAGENVVHLISMSSYFSFTAMLLVGFGLSFELPLVMTLVARLGLVGASTFSSVRRWALIVLMIVSALLTPQDPGSMILMAIPLAVLYEVGIVGAKLFGRKGILT